MSSPSAPAPSSGRRGVVVATLILVAVVIGIVLAAGVGDPDETSAGPAAPSQTSASASDVGAAEAAGRWLVDELEHAWDVGSRADFAALAADSPRGRRETTATWRALSALDVDRFDLRWVASAVSPSGAPSESAAAVMEATWTQPGWRAPATSEVALVHTVESADGELVGGLLGLAARPGDAAPLWSMAPLELVRTPSGATVAGLPGRPLPGTLVRLVQAADLEVRAVLRPGRTARAPLLVAAPATATQFADLVGDRTDYSAIAAVTTTADGSVRGDAPVHVLLNPAVFDQLGPVAAGVVLSHEATHVVTGATSASLSLWVAEGFADFVALRDDDVPVRVAAGRALDAVRRGGPPAHLPTAADFATEAHGLGRAYELAWMAFRVLEQRVGTAATVDFYRTVVAGNPVGSALRRTTGLDVAELTRAWRAELVRLSGVPG